MRSICFPKSFLPRPMQVYLFKLCLFVSLSVFSSRWDFFRIPFFLNCFSNHATIAIGNLSKKNFFYVDCFSTLLPPLYPLLLIFLFSSHFKTKSQTRSAHSRPEAMLKNPFMLIIFACFVVFLDPKLGSFKTRWIRFMATYFDFLLLFPFPIWLVYGGLSAHLGL